MSNNNDDIKQIQFSPDLLKVKKKRQTRKKPPAAKLSAKTANTIKNNLVQRIQSHKMDELGGIEKIHSNQSSGFHSAPLPPPVVPATNHLSDAMSYLSNIKGPNPLNKTMKQPLTKPTLTNPASTNPASGSTSGSTLEPAYGILKGGTKPSYRSWVNQTLKHPHTNHSAASSEDSSQPSVLKVVRKRKMTLGKNKHNVGVLVKNAKTRKDIMQAKNEIQNAKIHDIKHDLFKKGMIRTGSLAPDDVLKNMYESSILAGHVTNKSIIYQNALDDIEEKLH